VLHRGRWAVENHNGTNWHYCCRTTYKHGHLISADYHYVEGEVQRHWPPDNVDPSLPDWGEEEEQPTTESEQDNAIPDATME